jgi:MoxR-like ATPase|tara:strand:+ start:483 stop:1610 length:1128 start_codon:yes stop_codon:yes gene_type:complete
MEYKQVLRGYYDTEKRVKAIDLLTDQPYFIEDRPDMKQRIERAINFKQLLAVYQRGTRNGFKYIEQNDFTEETIPELTKPITTMNKPDDFIISDLKWKYLVRCINRGKNLMFVGPAGTGKTQVVFKAADMLDRKIFYFNLGSTQDVRSAIIGNTYFKDGTYFEESAFVTALKTPNTIILLDEISRANPEAWNILMPVLDANIRKLRLDEKENSPVIDVADGVSFISTANIGFEYTSARMLDRALVDRFSIVEMDTLDKEQEMKLLAMKYSKLNPQVNEALCDISFRIRMECERENSKLSSTLSTRTLIEAAEMSIDDFSIDEIAELIFYPQYPEEGGTDSERIYVRQLVQKYIQKGSKENLFTDDDFRALDNYDI